MSRCLDKLGLADGSSPADIKTKWKEIAWEKHPDRGGDADEFAVLSEAYAQAMTEAKNMSCSRCNGTGQIWQNTPGTFMQAKLTCPKCQGSRREF